MKITILYHSGYGHTQKVAETIAAGARQHSFEVLLTDCELTPEKLEHLNASDLIIFGSPTYFGTVSAAFKTFMEGTATIWGQQRWKNKFAAGFTHSSTLNGDKLNTLQTLAVFAAQHGMIWLPLGMLPEFEKGKQKEDSQNQLGSYLGLMTKSDSVNGIVNEPDDLATAFAFGARLAALVQTMLLKAQPISAN